MRSDRILVLTGICCVLIVLGFRALAFNAVSSKGLGRVIEVQAPATSTNSHPYAELLKAGTLMETYDRFVFAPKELEFPSTILFEDAEVAEFRDRRSKEDRFRRAIAPPLELSHSVRRTGVLLEWKSNPSNEALQRETSGNPLLNTGYRIYRWRSGEDPQVIASGNLDQTSYLDEELGPRGGEVFYAVLTVLEGRIGTRDTVIESQRTEPIGVSLEDAFELRLVAGDTERVEIEVSVPTPGGLRTTRYALGVGDAIGDVQDSDGTPVDFATGLVIESIREVDTHREEHIRHPVFEPDGSRAFDENGFLFRDEIRKIPVRRLEVSCARDRAAPRVLSLDRS